MKTFLMMLVVGLALMPVLNAQPPANRPLRIMVVIRAMQGTSDSEAEFLRSKLVSSLSRRCGSVCIVVEQAPDADETKMDAILTGSTVREISCYGCNPDVQGAMRLVAKDGTVLWSDTVLSERFARSATSSFADNVAKKLVSHLASKPLPAGEETSTGETSKPAATSK